jgi:hypothetical protein
MINNLRHTIDSSAFNPHEFSDGNARNASAEEEQILRNDYLEGASSSLIQTYLDAFKNELEVIIPGHRAGCKSKSCKATQDAWKAAYEKLTPVYEEALAVANANGGVYHSGLKLTTPVSGGAPPPATGGLAGFINQLTSSTAAPPAPTPVTHTATTGGETKQQPAKDEGTKDGVTPPPAATKESKILKYSLISVLALVVVGGIVLIARKK